MRNLLLFLNIVTSVLVVGLVLIQGRGGGLGSAWGGGGETFQTRRGVEKLTLRLTVALIGLFLVFSVINLFVRS